MSYVANDKRSYFQKMKKHYVFLCVSFILGIGISSQFIACNEVSFARTVSTCEDFYTFQVPESSCSMVKPRDYPEEGNSNVSSPPAKQTNSNAETPLIEWTTRLGQVDIIFAIDNSKSMEVEHGKIAENFDRFLDKIKDVDYRIAIVTVDISSSPGNKHREFQDGRFVLFDDGSKYLHNQNDSVKDRRRLHSKNINLFKKTVERPETRNCTRGSGCPEDERAICALNKSLDVPGQDEFFRKDGHLMVIVLSDEDERTSQNFIKENQEYRYENCDFPDSFYSKVFHRMPLKTLSVHAIIIPPGDESCLDKQNKGGDIGYYGNLYKKFATPSSSVKSLFPNLMKGSVRSICSDSYDSQLSSLGRYLEEPRGEISLPCAPYYIEVNDKRTGDKVNFQLNNEKKSLKITDSLPLNSKIKLKISCDPLENPKSI